MYEFVRSYVFGESNNWRDYMRVIKIKTCERGYLFITTACMIYLKENTRVIYLIYKNFYF